MYKSYFTQKKKEQKTDVRYKCKFLWDRARVIRLSFIIEKSRLIKLLLIPHECAQARNQRNFSWEIYEDEVARATFTFWEGETIGVICDWRWNAIKFQAQNAPREERASLSSSWTYKITIFPLIYWFQTRLWKVADDKRIVFHFYFEREILAHRSRRCEPFEKSSKPRTVH